MENQVQNTAPSATAPEVAVPSEVLPQAPKQGNNSFFKWLILGLLGLFLVLGSFGIGMWVSDNKKQEGTKVTPTEVLSKPSPTITQAMSTLKPTVTTEIETTPSAELEQEQAKAAIKAAMAQKFDKQIDEVQITISDYQPSFAKGGVTFSGEMGGGWFLAAEVGGTWVIVQDGNGTVTCEVIDPYNFPVSMVSECWSETSQELIYR